MELPKEVKAVLDKVQVLSDAELKDLGYAVAELTYEALLGCPFCGDVPELPSGDGTQYEIWCGDCGQSVASVQISDHMTIEERIADDFSNYRYGQEYIDRAKAIVISRWNDRV